MKRTVWNITLASLITFIVYIALYAILGAILGEIENPTISLFLLALMTTAAFSSILIYTSKIRNSVGEDEVVSDYKDSSYISFVDDFKLIIKRESQMLVCIAMIVLICFSFNTFDVIIFGVKTISFPTLIYAPMWLFDSTIDIPFVGYAVSAVLDCVLYIIFLLIYRRKKYNYWMTR